MQSQNVIVFILAVIVALFILGSKYFAKKKSAGAYLVIGSLGLAFLWQYVWFNFDIGQLYFDAILTFVFVHKVYKYKFYKSIGVAIEILRAKITALEKG